MENLQKNLDRSLPRNKTIENKATLERKIKLALGVLVSSVVLSLPNKVEAQDFKMTPQGYEVDSNTMEIKHPSDTLNPSKFAEMREEAVRQRDWILKYMQSPKYRERIAKEYFWFKVMIKNGYDEDALEKMANMEKTEIDSNGDTLWTANIYNKYIIYLKQAFAGDSEELFKIENFFGQVDLSTLTKEDWEHVDNTIKERFDNVKNGPWMIAEWKSKILGVYYPKGYLGFHPQTNVPLSGLVVLKNTKKEKHTNTTTHEKFGHQSDNGGIDMNLFTKYFLAWKAHSGDEYLDEPTEVYARLCSFREHLARSGLYDPCTEDFNIEILKKVLENKEYKKIRQDSEFKQLLDTIDEDVLIWLMNNVADADIIIRFDENGRLKGINDIFIPDLGNQTATG